MNNCGLVVMLWGRGFDDRVDATGLGYQISQTGKVFRVVGFDRSICKNSQHMYYLVSRLLIERIIGEGMHYMI